MNWIGRIGDGNRDGDDGDVTNHTLCHMVAMRNYHDDGSAHTSYLSFFLHWQNFWRIKFTPKNANFSR